MSILAEQNVIGALMMDAESISKICTRLYPEMFSDDVLGAIYAEYVKGFNENYEVNLVVLNERVDQRIPRETLQQTLFDCSNVTATSASIESYADVVIDEYKARQLESILQRVVPMAADIDEQIRNLIMDLEDLADEKETHAKTLAEITRELEDKYFCEKTTPRMFLGMPQLDDMLGGFDGGDMVIIGARPAVGKSAFVSQVSMHLADQGFKIGYYSLEMQENQMYERFLGSESELGVQRVRRSVGYQNNEEEQVRRANELLEKQDNITIVTGSKSVSEIRAESRHADYDLIIIDYLQLLKPDTMYRGNRYAEVGAISHAIKNLAMELDIPIIALSQMNRVSEQRDTKEPTMSELRESGDVEQDASTIILLWNKDENDKGLKGCKIEKQRQGITGSVTLRFDGDKMHFEELPNDDLPFEY